MNTKYLFFAGASILASTLGGVVAAQETEERYVQIAEIEIDPAQLDSYKAAVAEHAATAVRAEPGVLVLYAVSEKNNPTRVRVFEVYASTDAYRAVIAHPPRE